MAKGENKSCNIPDHLVEQKLEFQVIKYQNEKKRIYVIKTFKLNNDGVQNTTDYWNIIFLLPSTRAEVYDKYKHLQSSLHFLNSHFTVADWVAPFWKKLKGKY